jgi:putative peptidoglycan lipid II flippase
MAVATLASRLTGFVRILVLVAALGLGSGLLDSYNVANALPNAVYDLVVGGAMASVVVPLLARAALTEPDDGVVYAQRLLTLMAYGLGAVTVLATLLAPVLVALYAPGLTPADRHVAVVFSRYFLPQVLFYGLSATAGAVLNVRGRFTAPMWAPLANNLVVIAVGSGYLLTPSAPLLAVGTTAGVAAQLALVLVALSRSGFPLRPRLDPRGIGMRRIARLGGWVVVSVAAAQTLVAVATRSASLSGPGGISAYQTAYAVFQVPYAVVALSVMTAVLPRLSRSAAHRDHGRLVADLSRTVRLAVVALAPAAAALFVLGPALATVLFAHGRSAAATVGLLGAVAAGFGLALVPFAGYMVLLRGFYALQDTRTPALLTCGVAVVGVAGCLVATAVLPRERITVGIPVAYAVAYTAGLLTAAVVLRRRLGRIDGRRLVGVHARAGVAAVLAGAAGAAAVHYVPAGVATALVGAATGAVVYLAAARLLRLTELRDLVALRARRRASPA